MDEKVIKVQGMTCGHCVRNVETKVGALAGVGSVKVDLKAGEATVRFEPKTTSIKAIVDVIENAGYEAQTP